MVYTSYFGKMKSFPPNMIPIAESPIGTKRAWRIKDGYGIKS